MTFKKETFIFLTSLALILIIGYINLIMSKNAEKEGQIFDEAALQQRQEEFAKLTSDITDKSDLGDILNNGNSDNTGDTGILNVNSTNDNLDVSFENFKISKAKSNLETVDQIERTISSPTISQEAKVKFEDLLLAKNKQIQMESSVELMLKSKGYNNFVCIISSNDIKIIADRDIEKADALKILDVVMSETQFDPQQIKIVKFNNKEL